MGWSLSVKLLCTGYSQQWAVLMDYMSKRVISATAGSISCKVETLAEMLVEY